MIMFCLPGNDCTRIFRNCWTSLVQHLEREKIDYDFRDFYCSDVYVCRNELINGNRPGIAWPDLKPFNGRDYDYMFWIDSDMEFTVGDVMKLMDHDKDIVSGATIAGISGKMPHGYFRFKDGRPQLAYFHSSHFHEYAKENADKSGLIEVDFTGFAFLCVKRGVFESIGYPWFQTTVHNHGGKALFCTEDVGWCVRAREKGYTIYVDSAVEIGHEKRNVLTTRTGPYSKRTTICQK